MKRILFIILLCNLTFTTFSQTVLDYKGEELKTVLIDYYELKYANTHPKIFCGIYKQSGSSDTEAVVILNEDGTCRTEWYNSRYSGQKRRTTPCTWGVLMKNDEAKEFYSDKTDDMQWYKIIIKSNDGKKLSYYDKPAYFEWVGTDAKGNAFLKFIFSTLGKEKKQ